MYIPDIDPFSFTGTAVILGYLLTNDFTIDEQAALGAWFNVVGDILASNAAWADVLESRQQDNKENDLEVLNEAIDKLKESIEELKKKSND
ncbi:hypothetical protein [Thomasclavelia saccharogumia]|uniref:hypothetical protein n=1 Tax=Thomasclavelia saccharogumia TaxID=341225 RepID=UPI00047B43C5|nr:hypothetical protein [Thomasclavelia saccharogumia]